MKERGSLGVIMITDVMILMIPGLIQIFQVEIIKR